MLWLKENRFLVANAAAFQLLWFAAVVAAGAYGYFWIAALCALPIVALSYVSDVRKLDWQIAAVCVCCGLLLDNSWVFLDILTYPRDLYAPAWIGLLWLGFGLTVNHSLSFFRDRPVIGPVVVGAFAPVTYLAGQRFGAVTIEAPLLMALISVSWAGLFTAVSAVVRSLDAPMAAPAGD